MGMRPMTMLLIIANVAIYFWMMVTFKTTTDPHALISAGAMYAPTATWQTFFTANFLHIGLMHLVSNMISLYIFGGIVEGLIGSWRFTLIYLISGLVGTTAVYFFNPTTVTAGASTSIFGLMGVMIVLIFKYGHLMRDFSLYIVLTVGYNLYNTFTTAGISIPGHIGGLIAGLLLAILLTWNKDLERYE
jgi:S54 family peptidase